MTDETPDHNRGFAEAAKELGIYESWLRTHSRELPHLKIGRTVIFRNEHLDAIRAQFQVNAKPRREELRPVGNRRRTA